MENNDISENKFAEGLTDEEMEFLSSSTEIGKAWEDIISFGIKAYSAEVDDIKELYPEFQGKTLKQLNDDEDFQQALKEHRAKYPALPKNSEISDVIETLHSIIPETFYITNNRLSNEITKDFANKGNKELAVINSNKKGEIVTYNSLTYEGKDISITGRYEFTAYDRAIHNAVCTLYAAGNDILTPAMVYRAVNGMSENEKVSPQAMEAVKNSLDKSRFMRLKVDYTDEAKARNINVDKAEIDSNLLEARVITVEAGGNKVDAYKIHATPVLYQYSQRTKQIISIPLGLLDTKEATRNTEEIISIKEYLIRRIEIMKREKCMEDKILYDTIFDEIGIIIKSQKQRDRMRGYIKSLLSLWITRDKYIKDFKEYKDGKITKGIEIFY